MFVNSEIKPNEKLRYPTLKSSVGSGLLEYGLPLWIIPLLTVHFMLKDLISVWKTFQHHREIGGKLGHFV